MKNDVTLHLVKEEITLFEKLPAELQKKWKANLKEEKIDAYESAEEITDRLKNSRFELPGIEEFAKKMSEDPNHDPSINFAQITDSAWGEYFYTIGASGLSALIQISIQDKSLGEAHMEFITRLSRARHIILEENSRKKR